MINRCFCWFIDLELFESAITKASIKNKTRLIINLAIPIAPIASNLSASYIIYPSIDFIVLIVAAPLNEIFSITCSTPLIIYLFINY